MKQFKAIFFDWDGTAVLSRNEVPERLTTVLTQLLEHNVQLIIISGTTYENIAGGKLHEYFPPICHKNLFMGLGRGCYNYGFEQVPYLLKDNTPSKAMKRKLEDACYTIHRELFDRYNYLTDITFTRPNYCKIDLLPTHNRKNHLFMNTSEIVLLNNHLEHHGFMGGIQSLLTFAQNHCKSNQIDTRITTDAKYLEIGFTTKSDNTNFFMTHLNLDSRDCVYFGDEFSYIDEGIPGSDAYMCTEMTLDGEFYDVNNDPHFLPKTVTSLKGATDTFYEFLCEQLKYVIGETQ